MSDPVRPTPLHAIHEELGATFTEFAGWRMPLRYTGDTTEHHAVRQAAGLFDLSHMGEIRIRGPEAAAALDYAVLTNASAITVGRARYTMLCTDGGGILDDLIVYRTGQQEFLVVANAANVDVVRTELAIRVTGFDATSTDESEQHALIAVQGPNAASILAPLTPAELADLRYYASLSTEVAGYPVLLARTGYTGEDGFELFTEPDAAPTVWRALSESGANHGLQPAGLSCRDTLRLEAGMPLHGNELSPEVTPYHVNLDRIVKLDKQNEFVGKDALAALAHNPPTRTLVGLVARSRRAPRHGYAVLDPDTKAEIGTITSGAPSPTLGHPIAMASIDRQHCAPGTSLSVDIRGNEAEVDVVELPFLKKA